MATPKVYVICDQNCKFEGMTKEQILTAIVQAVNEGTIGDIDTGFITTIKTINGLPLRFFVGEQSAFEALTDEEKKDLFAIITNDTTTAAILEALESIRRDFDTFYENLMSGKFAVPNAISANTAIKADRSDYAKELRREKTFTTYNNEELPLGVYLFAITIFDQGEQKETYQVVMSICSLEGVAKSSTLFANEYGNGGMCIRLCVSGGKVTVEAKPSNSDTYVDAFTNMSWKIEYIKLISLS